MIPQWINNLRNDIIITSAPPQWLLYHSFGLFIKPGTCGRTCLVSWNCFGSHVSLCVCLCVHSEAINNEWCDIDRVLLVKQVLQLFPAFNYFIRHFLLIKWMGVAILTQHVVNTCQRKLTWRGTSYKRTTWKMECFIHKSE